MKKLLLHITAIGALVLSLMAFSSISAQAQTKNYKAYSLFVYNFMKHTQWPNSNRQNYSIAVVGDAKATAVIKEQLEGRRVNGLGITVTLVKSDDNLSSFDLVYIPFGKSASTNDIVASTGNKPVLIVTERDDQLRRGACIAFIVLENGSLRFKINEEAVSNRKLQLSGALKSMATT